MHSDGKNMTTTAYPKNRLPVALAVRDPSPHTARVRHTRPDTRLPNFYGADAIVYIQRGASNARRPRRAARDRSSDLARRPARLATPTPRRA